MKKKNVLRKRKGFTLIELIVVIAILGILAIIAIPRFTGMREGANLKAVTSNLRTIQNAVEVVATEKNIGIDKLATTGTDGTVTAITGTLAADDLSKLLGKWPEGPGGVTYTVSSTGEATASVPAGIPFPVTIPEGGTTYTLDTILDIE